MIFDNKPLDFNYIKERLILLPQHLSLFEQQISAVLLFGSLASSKETPLSDIDLAVLYKNSLTNKELHNVHSQVHELVSDLLRVDDFDLINLNKAPLTIQYGVIKESKLLLLNNREEYIDFWEKTVKYYLDFKPLLDECNNALLETLTGRFRHGRKTGFSDASDF